MHSFTKSEALYAEALKTFVKGVGSDERAGVKPCPIYMTHGVGSHLFDVDGNEYIDYQMAFGALIQGHCPENVVAAVKQQLDLGTMFGTPCELEIEATQKICQLVPSVETVRFLSSGTEAVWGAVRAARAYTGKKKIIKFEGHYHGWLDPIHMSHLPAKDAVGDYDHPNKVLHSAGQSASGCDELVVLPWNDLAVVEKAIQEHKDGLAAIITEPILFNCAAIMPREGYLAGLRKLTADNDILLIFDEVQTGFRASLGGAQALFNVLPDITVMGKGIANGFPVSAYGGSREVLETASANGQAHAGTYNSNPLVMAAVCANLDDLSHDNGAVYQTMSRLGVQLRDGLLDIYRKAGWPARASGPETICCVMLYEGDEVTSLRDYYKCDLATLESLRSALRERGVYTRASQRDLWYISTAHTQDDINRTLEIVAEVVPQVAQKELV